MLVRSAALHAREIDVGFVRQPGKDKALAIETVTIEPLLLAVNKSHPLAGRTHVPLAQLAKEDFVLFPKDLAPGLHATLAHAPLEYGMRAARPVLETIARYSYEQGLTPRRIALEEIFARSTMEL